MAGNQCWITYASDDHEALRAIILARSLKRVITRRSLAVFVSHEVSAYLRSLLQDEFHWCMQMDEKKCQKFKGIPFGVIALVHSWNLCHLTKFVFLDCNSMIVRNSDELFKTMGATAPLESQFGKARLPLIVDRPSELKFKKLISFYTENMKKSTQSTKNRCWDLGSHPVLQDKYCVVMDLKNRSVTKDIKDINILNFVTLHPMEIFVNHIDQAFRIRNAGTMEKKAVSLFYELFMADDLPKKISEHVEVHEDVMKMYMKEYKTLSNPLSTVFNSFENLKDSIAIVGMSFRLPGANNVDEFWDLLANGREGIIKVPEFRWNDDQCFVRNENAKDTEAGFLNVPIDGIDGKFFGLSPKELALMDPQQRLVMEVIWEGLEHACINPGNLKNANAGVFGGWWRNDYKEILQEAGLNAREFFRTYMGNSLGTLTGRISHILDTTGPSISTESGCSTSIVAVDMACKSLANEDCDLGLAFGVNLLLHPFSINTLNTVVAVDGRSKTFDADADGFGRAEGCTVLILKRFPDAVRDKDRIWGLIRGSAVVQEGPSRSMGTPTVQCEALAMQLALERAGVEPNEVSFVEAHGTGTPVGDPLEIAAVAEVYSKNRTETLTIGSVKTNIGHTESCSGIAGIIKTVLSLKNELIPQHLNLKKLNPEIHLETIPARIPLSLEPWKKSLDGTPRIAGVSSFGITGTDAHVIIQEIPEMTSPGLIIEADVPYHILKASAKCPEALKDIRKSYQSFLNKSGEKLQDVIFSSNVGKGDYSYRCFSLGQNANELAEAFDKAMEPTQIPKESPKMCFLFTGQGSQYPGMAQALYEHSPTFKMSFDVCDITLQKEFGISIKSVMWGDKSEVLKRTIYSQTSIFCVEYCLLKLWESWGIKPDCVLGHSLGEFAAAVAAGILSFEDALTLVAERSRLIDSLAGGKMLVLKENVEKVKELIERAFFDSGKWLDYAAVNSSDQTVLAGSEENVKAFASFCENNQIKTHILEATHAFHSRHMDPILQEYRDIASSLTFSKAKIPFISGMEGRQMEEGKVDAEYWIQHTRKGVQFIEASKTALQTECVVFLEIGPHPVLSALTLINSDAVGTSGPIVCLPSLRKNESEWPTILNTLGRLYTEGFHVDWDNFHQYSSAKKITVPFYPFQKKPIWFDFKGDKERPFHPLVGAPLTNSSPLKLFNNNLDVDHVSFLKDHVIGSTIVFPGAGFLEMCMVSGFAACQCLEGSYAHPITPITIEDFQIEAPLALYENERTQLQEIVSTEDNGETRVTIYSRLVLDKENSKWIRHASGVFSPFAVQWNGEDIWKKDSLEDIKARCQERIKTDQTYDKLTGFGLKFGPTFRTLRSAWKGDEEAYCEVAVTDNPNSYICHPVMIDAMFQAMMINNPTANKLHVPISVSKFIWYSKITTETCFIHGRSSSKKSENDDSPSEEEITVVLYDSNGQRIAVMIGAAFIETTVSSIMSVIEAQRTSLPSMYEDIWREKMGPLDKRFLIGAETDTKLFSLKFKEELVQLAILDDTDHALYEKTNDLYLLYIIDGLLKLGYDPQTNETFQLDAIIKTLGVLPAFKVYFNYMLMELAKEGFLKVLNWEREAMEFQTLKRLPSLETTKADIDILYQQLKSINPEVIAVSATGRHIAEQLTGKQSALAILFPENLDIQQHEKGPAELYYEESLMHKEVAKGTKVVSQEVLTAITRNIPPDSKNVMRILEVGAGTGSFTRMILPHLDGMAAEFTYTDISKLFFSYGEKVFASCSNKIEVIYKTFNVEEDHLAQGFLPHHYDVIAASFVLHATKNIKETVANLKNLLRPGGILTIQELSKPSRGINLLFGAVEGFARFTDYDLRPYNCELSTEKWEEVLKGLDFVNVTSFPCCLDHAVSIISQNGTNLHYIPRALPEAARKTWVIIADHDNYFRVKLSEMGRDVIVVRSSKDGLKSINENLWEIQRNELTDMISVFDELNSKKLDIEGILYLWGYENTEDDYELPCLPYLNLCKAILRIDKANLYVITRSTHGIGDHELTKPHNTPIWGMTKGFLNEYSQISGKCIDITSDKISEQTLDNGLLEMFMNDTESAVAYRGNQRYIKRFVQYRLPKTALSFPKSNRFQAILPSSNAIPDLKFGPAEVHVLGDHDVEIAVKAYGLNFKDLLTVLKPTSDFDKMDTLGLDYSGVVTAVGSNVKQRKVGDAVFGINRDGGAYPSHLKINEELTMSIPKNITFWEAATLPAVAATAYISLVNLAKLKENETILIHTGSGGVGLLAIQVAQSLKCNIVTTAGSARKRTYLKNIGVKHVFYSRNTSYEKDIRNALGGGGVDVVLNSLTGTGFKEASLAVCNQGARFIEMSLINTWTKEEVAALRPDVDYQLVRFHEEPEPKIKEYLGQVEDFLNKNSIKPIPYVRFDISAIRGALTYMQKAKHVGKIVCIMPERKLNANSELMIPLFNDQSTYLITGGLGGIGMEIAKWMTTAGAKHIVLVGRNPPSEKAVDEIEKMNYLGGNVIAMQCNVGIFNECQALLETIKSSELSLPILRGVMHAAGVLSDAFFENQSWEKYQQTFTPKIKGGWNLHQLTLTYPIEHFVMFSSIVSLFGSLGQSSHCAANVFLDSLAEYRNSIGLPATSVNWGQWGQVGVAASIEVTGVKPMSTLQTIEALNVIMRSQRLQTCVSEMNIAACKKTLGSLKSYFEEVKAGQEENVTKVQIDGELFWKEYDATEDIHGKIEVVKKYVGLIIREILKMDDNDPVDNNANFQDMGMDSLMMIEMKNSLQTVFGNRAKITISSVKDCTNINQISTRVVELVSGTELPPPTREELKELIREDSKLPVEIIPHGQACKASEIRTVLITGVTGNFGPYVLREISKLPQIEKVYCLMRPNPKVTPDERLRKTLAEKNLASDIRMKILECVHGTMTEEKLGISEEIYSKLAREVDAVINLAVKADIQAYYRKGNASDRDSRTINVMGLKNVLAFACNTKLKHVYHASTMLIATELKDGRTSEEWPEISNLDNFANSSYPISKFICDLLMSQAVERGIPCKVFRFPFMGVDSKTGGNVAVLSSHLLLRMMAYMYMGIMPAISVPFLVIPIDICANFASRIFFSDDTGFEIYNVSTPFVHDEQELEDIASDFGYPVEVVEPDEFFEKVDKMEDHEIVSFAKNAASRSKSGDERQQLEDNLPDIMNAYLSGQKNAFLSKKLEKLIPEYPECLDTSLELLKKDLQFAKDSGVFDKAGLKRKQ